MNPSNNDAESLRIINGPNLLEGGANNYPDEMKIVFAFSDKNNPKSHRYMIDLKG